MLRVLALAVALAADAAHGRSSTGGGAMGRSVHRLLGGGGDGGASVLDAAHEMLRVRVDSAKTAPPFDMNPQTWVKTVGMFDSDLLVLFYSTACPDCERFMKIWRKMATNLEADQGLTLLSVLDPEGLAPGKYVHEEIPAIFFVPRGHPTEPVGFSIGAIHAFTDTDETPDTEEAIYEGVLKFARSHRTAPDAAVDAAAGAPMPAGGEPTPPVAGVPPAGGPPAGGSLRSSHDTGPLDFSKEDRLNARFLTALKSHEGDTLDQQLDLVGSAAYKMLPAAQFILQTDKGEVEMPLVKMATRYLDEEPKARQLAESYTSWFMHHRRSRGQAKAIPYRERYMEVYFYALPMYAQTLYRQAVAAGQ